MENKKLRVYFYQGYAGIPKAEVEIGKNKYVLDLDILKDRLEKDILEKGYTISKTARQKYPRIIINN